MLSTRGKLSACSIAIALILLQFSLLSNGASSTNEGDRTAWFREAKFGMFIHWGIYSVLGRGEWVMYHERIAVEEYEKLVRRFNPVNYNPYEWVALAKEAGMKYIIITSKHHDGFCMFSSVFTNYDCMSTPARRDFIRELVEACHKAGMRIGFYYSLLDWHHPHYAPRPKWVIDPPWHTRNFNYYLEYMFAQIRELCTRYGKIDCIWFDGGWHHSADEWRSEELIKMIRKLQPRALVNNRARLPGDFDTPEQRVPPAPPRRIGGKWRLWETCMTINRSWGYNARDQNYKSVRQLIQTLVDIVSKGGNFLLNVGPKPDGTIQREFVVRLRQMGAWLRKNGEAIYGAQPSPFRKTPFGRCTMKGNKLYLHVFDWITEPLVLSGLKNRVVRAYLLRDGTPVPVRQEGDEVTIEPIAIVPDPYDTIIVLELIGEPQVETAIQQASDGSITLHARDAEVHGTNARYEFGDGKDNIGYWTNPEDYVTWEFIVREPATFSVEITYACDKGVGGSEYLVKVGKQTLSGVVKDTGSWTKFVTEKLGTLMLDKGRYTLTVRPIRMPHFAVMNLKQVILKPKP